MHDEGMIVGIVVPLAAFAMVVLMVLLLHLMKKHRIREQAELQRHFLDKFSSGQELTQFLETPQGQNFLKDLQMGGRIGGPKERIIRSVTTGIVLLALGAGFLALLRYDLRHENEFIYAAVVLLALGIGFLVSATVSCWLSKKWNIFEEKDIPLPKRADLKM